MPDTEREIKDVEAWRKKPSDHVVLIGDGRPPFKVDLSAERAELERQLKEKAK